MGTQDPSTAATCARPPAHARAPTHAHRMRQARVPKEWSCARALRCKWITRLTDSTNTSATLKYSMRTARAHTRDPNTPWRSAGGGWTGGAFPVGFGPGGAPDAAIRPGAGQQRRSGRRRRPPQPASATMAHPRHGRVNRPSGPVRNFRAGPDADLRRHSHRDARLPSRHAQRAVSATTDRGGRRKRTYVD